MAEITIHLDSALCTCQPISYTWTFIKPDPDSPKSQWFLRFTCPACGSAIQLPANSIKGRVGGTIL